MKIAAIADLHCRAMDSETTKQALNGIQQEADVLVLAGDLTDTGLPAEAEVLLSQLRPMTIPVIAVLGNHDHESDQAELIEKMLIEAGVFVLNGTVHEIDGVGFIGTKGFCGGFGSNIVQPFGERALKTFIQDSIDEAVRLESALVKLDCAEKVAILHYAPVIETLEGEPAELYPFLGSSRLGNAIDRQGVKVIFHGHAHHGSPTGYTTNKIPVYNVCQYVLKRHTQKSYCLYEI